MKRLLGAVLIGLGLLSPLSCGEPKTPPPAEVKGPAWQDAVEGSEALIAIVRPKSLFRDPVFGPLVRAGFAATAAREGSTPSLDVLASAEQLVIVTSADRRDGAMLVLEGVSADRSPDKVGDERGRALFRPGAEARGVSEWVSTQGQDLSLFVLPHRTWVIASDTMQKRARVAFANPTGRPALSYGDERSLAVVRLDGAALVRGTPPGRGLLGALTKNLEALIGELLPDKKGVNVTFRYRNDDQAGFAAVALEELKKRLGQDPQHRFVWTATATVARDGNRDVRVHVELPPDFVEQLRRVSPQDLITL